MSTGGATSGWDEPSGLPRPMRNAAIGLALMVIVLAGAARLTGSGHVATGPADPVQARALVFVDRPDGGVGVLEAGTDRPIKEIGPGEGGFVRGALRALTRSRRAQGIGAGVPFHLTRWSDGRLTLHDSSTGGHLEMGAFGPTNFASFEELLTRQP